jgi:hypothetical protein
MDSELDTLALLLSPAGDNILMCYEIFFYCLLGGLFPLALLPSIYIYNHQYITYITVKIIVIVVKEISRFDSGHYKRGIILW